MNDEIPDVVKKYPLRPFVHNKKENIVLPEGWIKKDEWILVEEFSNGEIVLSKLNLNKPRDKEEVK